MSGADGLGARSRGQRSVGEINVFVPGTALTIRWPTGCVTTGPSQPLCHRAVARACRGAKRIRGPSTGRAVHAAPLGTRTPCDLPARIEL